jgi:pimeloyl-ACP methyl ester carboxylesterase
LDGGTVASPDGGVELACKPDWESAGFAAMSHLSWRRLKKTKCPVGLIYGGLSNAFFDSSARRFRLIRPDARILKVDPASHFVPMEYPQTVLAAIRRTLTDVQANQT